MPRTDEMAEDTGGIVHAVSVNRTDAGEFLGMVWLCTGAWQTSRVVEKFLVTGKVVTCVLCLGTER